MGCIRRSRGMGSGRKRGSRFCREVGEVGGKKKGHGCGEASHAPGRGDSILIGQTVGMLNSLR